MNIDSVMQNLTTGLPSFYLNTLPVFEIGQIYFSYDVDERRWQWGRDTENWHNTTMPKITKGQFKNYTAAGIVVEILQRLTKDHPQPLPLYLKPKPAPPSAPFPTTTGATLSGQDEWVHDVIQTIFQINLSQPVSGGSPTNRGDSKVTLLPNLATDLLRFDAAAPHPRGGAVLNQNNMEVAVVESLQWQKDSVVYLVGCWNRIQEAQKNEIIPTSGPAADVLPSCRRLVVRYLGLCLMDENIFPAVASRADQFVMSFLGVANTSASEHGWIPLALPADGLNLLLQEFKEPKEREAIFLPALRQLSKLASRYTIAEEFSRVLSALNALCSIPEVLALIIKDPSWIPAVRQSGHGNAQNNINRTRGILLENTSFLGPFFGISASRAAARKAFFPVSDENFISPEVSTAEIEQRNAHNCKSAYRLLSDSLTPVIRTHFLGKVAREATLDWMAAALNYNGERNKLWAVFEGAGSDSFCITLAHVLLHLVAPVITSDEKMRDKIFVDYILSPKSRLDYSKQTRINAADNVVEEVKQELGGDKIGAAGYGFITESFFFAYHAVQVGVNGSINHLSNLKRIISHGRDQIQALRTQLSAAPGNPMIQMQLLREQDQYSSNVQQRFAINAALYEVGFAQRVFGFIDYAAKWLLRVAYNTLDFDLKKPLPPQPTKEWNVLPEYCIDMLVDVVRHYIGGLRHQQDLARVMQDFQLQYLPSLCVLLMRSAHYVQNPYVRAKYPEILSQIADLEKHGIRIGGGGTLDLPAMRDNLVPGLMMLYVDMENLGGHNQFYEKFTPRYYVAALLESIWVQPAYRKAFIAEASAASDGSDSQATRFVKFFNYLLNDANYLLDECFDGFKKIRDFEELQSQPEKWLALTSQERTEKETAIEQAKGRCTSLMQLANKSVDLMALLSRDHPEPFLRGELVEKVASMLNYQLAFLTGKAGQLNVANREKYNFKPKELLGQIVLTYVNFGAFKQFRDAVAADGRSYSPKDFDRAVGLLERRAILVRDEVHQFRQLCDKIKESYDEAQASLQIYGDEFPDEFTDPFSAELIHNPMQLPLSKQILDRNTILRHLLNDECDPFNRQPLTKQQLYEYNALPEVKATTDALKVRIDAWKLEKQQEKMMEIEDWPDEFVDPIGCGLISVPVELPASKQVMDRAVITAHLLNDECDPFNREALTLIALNEYNNNPDVKARMADLKARIDDWKKKN